MHASRANHVIHSHRVILVVERWIERLVGKLMFDDTGYVYLTMMNLVVDGTLLGKYLGIRDSFKTKNVIEAHKWCSEVVEGYM